MRRAASFTVLLAGLLEGTMEAAWQPWGPASRSLPAPLPRLGDLHFAKAGSVADERFGGGVVVVGDVNADGRDDVLVSSAGIDTCSVVSGRDGTLLRTLVDPGIYWPVSGFGAFIAATGDVNGDGVPDMSVGTVAMAGYGAPPVYVFDGATGSVIWSRKVYYGAAEGVGDLSGDGMPDVVIRDPNGSVIRAYQGNSGTPLWTKAGYRCFGFSSMPDVSGDGVRDLAVGDMTGGPSSRVVMLSGANGALIYQIQGPPISSNSFGYGIAAPGDLDGDGAQDLLIGDYQYNGPNGAWSGRIYQYSGVTLVKTWNGSAPGTVLGRQIEIAGDADADGWADFLSLEQGVTAGIPSRVLLFSGRTGSVLHSFVEEAVGDQFGVPFSGKADFNGDRYADFVIGAPSRTEGGLTDCGKAYFYIGGKP